MIQQLHRADLPLLNQGGELRRGHKRRLHERGPFAVAAQAGISSCLGQPLDRIRDLACFLK